MSALLPPAEPRGPARGGAGPGAPGAVEPAGLVDLSELVDLVEQAPCGYLTTDDAGVITWVNQTFSAWTGRQREDLIGVDLARLFPVGDRILWSASCVPALRTSGSVAEVMLEVLTAQGARRAVLLSATRARVGGGGPWQVKVVVFGAHERRAHQRQLVDALRRAQESERQRAAAEEAMRVLAVSDPLTALPNRRGLGEILTAALAGSAPARTAVLVIDIDHFKAVNDSLGHAAGDELLIVLAQRLAVSTGGQGSVARLAGDEFVVVVDVEDQEQAGAIARRLLVTVSVPVLVQDLEIVVSASIGIALAVDGEDAEQVMHRADVAMYRAKARGRNAVEVHDPHAIDPAAGRLRTLGELRAGIEREELVVHYQPRIDLESGQVCGAEALVRWAHPARGLLAPAQFIGIAEGSGLIHRLGARVLEIAIAQGASWAAAGNAVEIAVNLSARQLCDPDLAATVAATLSRHGLAPALLTLEVTETALMADPQAAAATLAALKALGLSLAVDDFGTGYASLTYLQRFPLDELKIDRSFVSCMQENPSDAAIVATCIGLARALGLRSVAEGVESAVQRDALLALACDQAQGYWFSPPVPPEQLSAAITAATAGRAGEQSAPSPGAGRQGAVATSSRNAPPRAPSTAPASGARARSPSSAWSAPT